MTNYHLSTGGSTSIFSSLKRIGKKRKRKRDNTRRHSIQKIMGVEEQEEEIPKSASEKVNYDTRTWPLKQGRRKKAKSPENVAKDYMKNPLLKDIESECTGDYNITPYAVSEAPSSSADNVKSHCRFLSLGSVLSFELPKDMTLIPSIQDIITIAPPDSNKTTGEDPDPLSQRQTALSSFKQTRNALAATTPENENAISCPTEKDESTVKQQSHVLKTGQCVNQLQVECSANTVLNRESDQQSNKIKNPIYVNHHPIKTCNKHECLSVHTLIKDLNGHKYHKCTRPHNGQSHSQASHMVVNLKSTVNVSVRQDSLDSGISSLGSLKLSSEIPSIENPPTKGIVGKMMSLEVGCIPNNSELKTNAASTSEFESDTVHVDHQQFEEEEEELEGIWSQNLRNSICSDIMYQPNQDETQSDDQPQPSSPPASKSPAVLFRNLVTASAPNLLVAEFKLPPSVQTLLGYDKCPNRHLSSLAVGERRSWAAFPNRDPPASSSSSCPSSATSVAVNETASDPVKLPEIEDSQRYIYQYREEEEEEREDEEEEEHTSCSKGEEVNCQQTSPTSEHMETQEHTTATGGRCITLSPELQSMEGPLERKQRLQLGGKKAASRGWSSYHTVLYRHTLCFYQDRKDILRSSSCGLPLNLIGAECVPAPEYTKKPNCFHLRLRDGSEYLLNASSRFLMKKWIMKIQANTGRPEASSVTSGVCRDVDLPFSVSPSSCSGCPSSHEVTSTFPQLQPRGSAQTALTRREFSHMSQGHLRSAEEKQDPSSAEGGWAGEDDYSSTQTVTQTPGGSTDSAPLSLPLSSQDRPSSQRRSHSFTSATYQKISPVLSSPGGRGVEKGSNYCVTLLVGDKPRDVPSVSHSSSPPMGEPSTLRYYTSLPRPRNKSVFKKFFGRKDY